VNLEKLKGVISTLQEIAQEVESEKEEKTVLDSKGKALTPWRSVIQYRAGSDRYLFIRTGTGYVERINLTWGDISGGARASSYTELFLLAPEIAELFRQKYERS